METPTCTSQDHRESFDPASLEDNYLNLKEALLSESLGSHNALHNLRIRWEKSEHLSNTQKELERTVQTERLQEIVRARWDLYTDYEDAAKYQPQIPSRAENEKDLASETIIECHGLLHLSLSTWNHYALRLQRLRIQLLHTRFGF